MGSEELANGTSIFHGTYTLESFVNSGGWSKAYKAVNSVDKKILLKECFPESFCKRVGKHVQPTSKEHRKILDKAVQGFVQEARNLAILEHPSVVKVYQVFEENRTAYMAMEFVEGQDLHRMIEEDYDFDPDELRICLYKLLDALNYIHEHKILHRDISPDNIIMSTPTAPVLIDFGAAHNIPEAKKRTMTAMMVVKDGYSPQEFYLNKGSHSPSSDLYSLGATFYHVITGEPPVNSQLRLTALVENSMDPLMPLAEMNLPYSKGMLRSIDRAMAIEVTDRFASAKEWLEELDSSENVFTTRRKSRLKSVGELISDAIVPSKSPMAGLSAKLSGLAVVGAAVAVGVTYSQFDFTPALQKKAAGVEQAAVLTAQRQEFLERRHAELEAKEAELMARSKEIEQSAREREEILKAKNRAAIEREAFLAAQIAQQEAALKAQRADFERLLRERDAAFEQQKNSAAQAVIVKEQAAERRIANMQAQLAAQEKELREQKLALERAVEDRSAARREFAAEMAKNESDKLRQQTQVNTQKDEVSQELARTGDQIATLDASSGAPKGQGTDQRAVVKMGAIGVLPSGDVGSAGGGGKILPLDAQISEEFWSLDIPFKTVPAMSAEGEPYLKVVRVDMRDAPDWLREGTEIYRINNQLVKRRGDFAEAFKPVVGHRRVATFAIKTPGSARIAHRILRLPETGHFTLWNGIVVLVYRDDTGWLARIDKVPHGIKTGLHEGDLFRLETAASFERSLVDAFTAQNPSIDLNVLRGQQKISTQFTLRTDTQ